MASPDDDLENPKTWGRPTNEETLHRQQADRSINKDNHETCINGESRKISDAFPQQPTSGQPIQGGASPDLLPRNSYEEDGNNDSGNTPDGLRYMKLKDGVESFNVPLTDSEPAGHVPAPHQPSEEYQPHRTPEPRDEDGGTQQNANGHDESNSAGYLETIKRWEIHKTGHLMVTAEFAALLDSLNLTQFHPVPLTAQREQLELEQSACVTQLANQGRQLAALRRAMGFAATAVLGLSNQISITAQVQLHYKDVDYPMISILVLEQRRDTQLQRYLAYYMVREMLKLYRNRPFPDRLDI
ncbi:hypothetical protein F4803DRAFT_494878 [Xylaria telfairii]|nr:hypothetical protein F4803DRAFT_494878 [Xylaria telfairii]